MQYGLLAIAILLILLLVGVCFVLLRKIRNIHEELDVLEQSIEQQAKALSRRLDNYLTGSIQMGEELHNLRQQVAPLPEKLMQMEQRDPSSLSFIEAARLVSLGATTEDLQQACGLSHAEAELLKRMHQKN
ncbi:MAG: DUF2802 domain-containing protein [Gammaproteobacteria bacterium]|nr:DUF2802 domain-containing protein [Gammaproteobacteria bacterium]